MSAGGLVALQRRRPLNPDSAGHQWRQVRKAAGLDGYTLHDPRHFYASGLAASGCDEVTAQRALGHSSATVTLEQDDSLLNWHRRRLHAHIRAARATSVRYEHRRAASDQLPGIPAATAWCWSDGGDWRRRIAPVVAEVRDV